MDNSYGIGVANRYELFYVDEEAGTGSNKNSSKKAKQQKKTAALATVAANVPAVKEIKAAPSNKGATGVTAATTKIAKAGVTTQNGTQPTNRNNPEKTPREGKENTNKLLNRNPVKQNGLTTEEREQRYNRKNRENRENRENQPVGNSTQSYNNANINQTGGTNAGRGNDERPIRRQGGNGNSNNDRGLHNRRFGGGKREFDRQSGSDKTGIKAIDKRDGGGAHNWGSIKQEIDDLNKTPVADWEPEQGKDKGKTVDGADNNGNVQQTNKENNADQSTNNQTEEDEAKEITLDEWKAQRAIRNKPQYNIRKAGEGEDTSQWKKMVALESRKKKDDENSDDELEYDPSKYPQRVGRQKHFLDIDFHFNDGPRSGPSRRRGRERTQRIWNGNQNGGPVNNGTDVEGSSAAVRNGNNERRRPPQQNNRNRNTDRLHKRGYEDRRGQNAPKVYDEHDFPSLG